MYYHDSIKRIDLATNAIENDGLRSIKDLDYKSVDDSTSSDNEGIIGNFNTDKCYHTLGMPAQDLLEILETPI